MIAKKYTDLLQKLTPFVLSYKDNFKSFNLSALKTPVESKNCFDCTDLASENFYHLIRKMDELAFGEQAMAMEGWTYFDCSAMPGAIVGFGLESKDIPLDLIKRFPISNDYNGLIPVSMFIAIPMVGERWFGHNLCSLGHFLDPSYKGLGFITKAYGIKLLGINEMFGATQWGSHALNIHSKLAPMSLKSAVTPIHTHQNTLSYSSIYSEEAIELALQDIDHNEDEDFLIESQDIEDQSKLQSRIQNGEKFTLLPKPLYREGKIYYKIKALKS